MRRFGISKYLLVASALVVVGCGGASVVKVNADELGATCNRVYFTSTIKQGDSYAESVPTLVVVSPETGVIPLGSTPQIDFTKPVLITLKVNKSETGCTRFPGGGTWRFEGTLPPSAMSAAGESVY